MIAGVLLDVFWSRVGWVLRVCKGDVAYPKRLGGLGSSAPKKIYVRGVPWVPEPMAIGVVGSRKASEAGRAWGFRLAKLAGQLGVAVVSGGALGIDRAAHEGALAGEGRTLVVLPGPVTVPTPRVHDSLFADILTHGGTLLSEHAEPPRYRGAFASRNRLIAALTDMLVVVEARVGSGTRHTVQWGYQLGRPVAFVRWEDDDPRGEGARDRGGAWCVEEIEEVLVRFRATTNASLRQGPGHSGFELGATRGETPEGNDLWTALKTPQTFDALVHRLAVSRDTLTRQLLEAEMAGTVERIGGRWRRCR